MCQNSVLLPFDEAGKIHGLKHPHFCGSLMRRSEPPMIFMSSLKKLPSEREQDFPNLWDHGYSMVFMDYDTHDTLQFIGKYNPQTNHQHTLALQTDSMIPL